MIVNTTPINNSRLSKFNQWNLVAYVLNVAVTYGIGMGWLNTPSNAELSLKYQTLVTPVGWAFSIWGIIFTLQAIWVLIPVFASQQRNTAWITAVGYNYVYVCLAQAAWTLTFSYEWIALSCICMLLILLFLVRAVRELLPLAKNYTVTQYTLRVAPFTIHMAWIMAASFVNLNVFLVEQNVASVVQFYAAVTSLLILFGAALFFLWRIADTVVPTVLAWALLGIYVELGNPADSIAATFNTTEIDVIRYAAASGAIIVVVGVVVRRVLTLYGVGGGANQQDAANTEEGTYLRAQA